MDYKKFKLIQQYNRVAMWNDFAGNSPHDDPSNQLDRVIEEMKEFKGHTETPIGVDYARKVAIVDDLADIFVTAAYLDYMNFHGSRCSVYSYRPNDKIDSYLISGNYHELRKVITPENALKVVCEIALSEKHDDFDLMGAIEHVMDSNFSKFIPRGASGWLDISLEEFKNDGVDVYVVNNNLYHVIKRKSDNKILKPVSYRPPELDVYVKKV